MRPGALLSRTSLAYLCLVSAGWAFSFGLGAPLSSIWLSNAGWSDTVVGFNTATYYLGIALAASVVPLLMRCWGRWCVIAGCIGSGMTVAVLPWAPGIAAWFGLRFAHGVFGAISLIPLETVVNRHSAPSVRARNFGCYAFAIALGWALGNFVGLQLVADAPRLAFVLGGTAALTAGLVLWLALGWPSEPPAEAHARGTFRLQATFLSFGSAWSQGFLEGGMVAFLAVYLLFLGMSDARVSWLTSGIMVGTIVTQVPIAWLADQWGRSRVLLGCYLLTLAALLSLPYCRDSAWLAGWLLLVGACSGAFYPLGLALLGERVPSSGLARANAWYLATNCLGSLMGPALIGAAMDAFGKPAIFTSASLAIAAVLLLWLTLQIHASRRRSEQHSAPPAVEIADAA